VCGVEAMSHGPYLLHKFIINYFFDYSMCLFELPTAVLEYLDLLQGYTGPLPPGVTTPMIFIMFEIQYSGKAW